jgi:hypothetical protein
MNDALKSALAMLVRMANAMGVDLDGFGVGATGATALLPQVLA